MSIRTTSVGDAGEQGERLFAVGRLVDGPALVLERELDRHADAFVVFDAQDPGTHGLEPASSRVRK